MRGVWVVGVLVLSGCMLDRSGTRPERTRDAAGLDAAALDAGPCVIGGTRSVACGGCGTQAERCDAGAWVPVGMCTEAPPCASGTTDTGIEACGRCGMREHIRTCRGCAGWGDFGSWSACTGEGACVAGDSRMREMGCACGGTMTVSESCDASCTWQPLSTGACSQMICTHPVSAREACDGETLLFGCDGGALGLRRCPCDGTTGNFDLGRCTTIWSC